MNKEERVVIKVTARRAPPCPALSAITPEALSPDQQAGAPAGRHPRGSRAREVGLHRVVDDEVGGADGVDPIRVAAQTAHRLPHGGEVHHGRHAGEVLSAGGDMGNFCTTPFNSGRLTTRGSSVPPTTLKIHAKMVRIKH